MTSWRIELRAQWALAAPIIVVTVGMMLLGVVDVMMVGHVGDDVATVHLAAVALGHLVVFGVMSFGMGTLMSLDPLVSQALGAGDEVGVRRAVQRGLVLALLLSVPIALLMLPADAALRWLDQQPEVIPVAASYVWWSIPGIPAFLVFVVFRQTLQAMHRLRPIVATIVVANLVNVVLNWALIYGRLGLPELGAVGCAIATSIGRWLMVALLLVVAWPLLRGTLRPLERRAIAAAPVARMLRLGAPIGVQVSLEIVAFNLAGVFMGQLGAAEVAGHQIALNLIALAFMVPLGISSAAAVRVGNAVGRGDQDGLRCAARVAIASGAGVMLVSASIFAWLPAPLVALYTDDTAPVAVAITLLPIAAIFQVFDGTQVVTSGVLRGIADTRAPMLFNLVGYYALGLPLGWWLMFRRGVAPEGMWWGIAAALAGVATLLVLRARSKLAHVVERVAVEGPRGGDPVLAPELAGAAPVGVVDDATDAAPVNPR